MRIWYQSLGRQDAWGGYPAHLRTMVDRARSADTEVRLEGTRFGVGVHHASIAQAARNDVLANLDRARQWGADAFVIGNFFDVGLEECRELAPFPVLGLGETSLLWSVPMGQSFGLICPNLKYAARLEQRIRGAGLDARFKGLAALDIGGYVRLGEAFRDAAAGQAAVEAMERCIETDLSRAEVVIPAGGVVMALLDKAGYRCTGTGAPILNGIAGLIQFAECAVRMAALNGGVFTSRKASHAAPSAEQQALLPKFD